MHPLNEEAVGFSVPTPRSLETVLARLEALSQKPEFAMQRELGLTRALKPYLQDGIGRVLPALPQETELANLSLLCDFYPEDGQLTLIEQLRDVITEHIPEEERAWLDPLKHSYVDLLEVLTTPRPQESLALRSLGDGTTVQLPYDDFARELIPGHVLLTRVIRDLNVPASGRAVWAGCGIVLSASDGKSLYAKAREWERRMEMSSGELVLGEWQEFTKRFGHILLWSFAEMRVAAVVDAMAHIRYRTADGQPYLYAIALYDHHDYLVFATGLSEMSEFEEQQALPASSSSFVVGLPQARTWNQRQEGTRVARLTLTSSQLIVECDTPERLDGIKHRLAGVFGFSLHFRGESLTPPVRHLSVEELEVDQPLTVIVTQEEDQTLLKQFLENAYLEWSDQPHHLLSGRTPRHAAADPATRGKVGALIDEMERHDPGRLRMGKAAFDYNVLRSHVGLDEVSA
ncbi:MAG TPA: hypothetical protein VFX36_01565 [Nitrospira sp.]|nr:hypothetical protein [Nitrospira sp.]